MFQYPIVSISNMFSDGVPEGVVPPTRIRKVYIFAMHTYGSYTPLSLRAGAFKMNFFFPLSPVLPGR